MKEFVVVYTNEDCIGNDCLEMTIDAPDLESAYELVNEQFPDLCIDQIYRA